MSTNDAAYPRLTATLSVPVRDGEAAWLQSMMKKRTNKFLEFSLTRPTLSGSVSTKEKKRGSGNGLIMRLPFRTPTGLKESQIISKEWMKTALPCGWATNGSTFLVRPSFSTSARGT